MKKIALVLVNAVTILVPFIQNEAEGGVYTNSAHGNSTYGAKRSSTGTYARGNCAHCHEQHASIGGSEPAPTGGPSGFLLFYDNYASQTDGLCLKCHTGSSSLQTGVIINRSYSFRAGAWTTDTLNNIKDAFSFTTSTSYPSSSSHDLGDIRAFISDSSRSAWNYKNTSNPCAACHNPHAAQGDPADSGLNSNSPKTITGGWMLSRPSQHGNSTVNLWGDVAAEKMSNYTALYQAPYRFGGGASYEPDGSGTTNGSNLTDFNTFCMDCHNSTNTIYSTLLGRNLHLIDWDAGAGDLHGQPTGNSAQLIAPYTSNNSYVLACTDCHEPHGSPNIFLTRPEVNNGLVTVTGATQSSGGTQWASLCERCHGITTDISARHHSIMGATPCATCHSPRPEDYISCTTCHYHGSSSTINSTTYRTF